METADAVKAVMTADRSESLYHLRRHAQELHDQLAEAGFESINFEFSEKRQDIGETADDDPMLISDQFGDESVSEGPTIYVSNKPRGRLDMLV